MQDRFHWAAFARGLAGAAVGGAVGYFAFGWLLKYGLYGIMLPGAAVGFGCSLAARQRLVANGVACALIALGLSLYLEWRFFRFVGEDNFGVFLQQLHQRTPVTLLMIAGGTILAYWIGQGTSAGPAVHKASE